MKNEMKITDPKNQHQKKKPTSKDNKKKYIFDTNIINSLHKQSKINVTAKVDKEIKNQLETLSIINDVSVSVIISYILEQYFKNKQIIRQIINLDKPVYIILPKDKDLINKCIQQKINLLYLSDYENNKPLYINDLHPLQKEYNKDNTKFEFITVNTTNNYFDKYYIQDNCYYSDYKTNKQDNTNNHLGLYTININDTFYLMLVHTINKTVIETRLINKETALIICDNIENYSLLKYLENIENNKISGYTNKKYSWMENKINELIKENNELKEKVKELEKRNGLTDKQLKAINNLERVLNDYINP